MKYIWSYKGLFAALLVILTSSANATDIVVNVDSSQTFESNASNSPGNLLGGVTECAILHGDHNYATQTVQTGSADTYTLTSTLQDFDAFFALYDENGFDPANPDQNLVTCDDDIVDGVDQRPEIVASLTAGTEYTLVVTSWSASPSLVGDVSITILPDITPVVAAPASPVQLPLLNTWGLLLLSGLLALVGANKVRRNQQVF